MSLNLIYVRLKVLNYGSTAPFKSKEYSVFNKQDYGYSRFRRRGLNKVSTESMLNYLGFNIAKLFR